MAPPVAAQQPAFLTNGLVAYYPFYGNANDESGNGLNGTLYNSSNVFHSENRFGTARSSFWFTDKINVTQPTIWGNGINISNSSHSITFWTFGDFSTPDDTVGVFMGRVPPGTFNPGGTTGKNLELRVIQNIIRYSFFYNQLDVPNTLLKGQWNQIVATYNVIDRTRVIYINGQAVGSNKADYSYTGTSQFEFFGIGNKSLDDIRIYNRSLSASEVNLLYTYEATPPNNNFIANGLIAHFPFNGSTSDDSGKGVVASIYNSSNTFLDSDRFGRNNSAYRFENPLDGVDPTIWGDGLNISGKSFSISIWVKGDFSLSKDDYAGFFAGLVPPGTPNPGGQQGKSLHWYANSKGMRFTSFYDDFDLSVKPESKKWTHLVATYNEVTSQRTLSINGVLVGQNQAQYGYSGTSVFAVSGRYGTMVDDVRVYEKALSAFEIKSLFEIESKAPISVSIIFNPTNISTDLTKDVSFSVTATNALAYQWFKDGNPLPSATNSTLSLTNARPALIGDYFAVASNAYGTATSSVASLNINGVDSELWKGLVAYYPLNGNANDYSGNENDGSRYGVTFLNDRFGGPQSSASFTGLADSYIEVKNSRSLTMSKEISISLWCNIRKGGSENPRLFSKGHEAFNDGMEIFISGTGLQPKPVGFVGGGCSVGTSKGIVNGFMGFFILFLKGIL